MDMFHVKQVGAHPAYCLTAEPDAQRISMFHVKQCVCATVDMFHVKHHNSRPARFERWIIVPLASVIFPRVSA